jgi:hypothetical protein
MSDVSAAILNLASDTQMEMIVATIVAMDPFTISWNGAEIPNPPSTTLSFAIGQYVLCLRQGASVFVVSPIVKRG